MPTLESLGNRFTLDSTWVEVAGCRWELHHPKSVDDLIDQDDFDRHQRLPYWGAVWPSARMLAGQIARQEGRGRRLLELGCGIGLVALAAAQAGFEVLATDYYDEACEFTEANAARNGLRVATRTVDWRRYPADLVGFDYVLASDVLYERPNAELVTQALLQSLAPGGRALLTDPGRRVARPFAEKCREHGLSCECVELEQIIDGAMNCIVELYEIRHADTCGVKSPASNGHAP